MFIKQEEERAKEMDLVNFVLGKYIMIAVNDPKKYPRKPFLETVAEPTAMSADAMEEFAKRFTSKIGGKVS